MISWNLSFSLSMCNFSFFLHAIKLIQPVSPNEHTLRNSGAAFQAPQHEGDAMLELIPMRQGSEEV